jgi:hypothetical protein
LFTVISYAVIAAMLSYTVCPIIHDEVSLINAKAENVCHHDFDHEKFYSQCHWEHTSFKANLLSRF